MSWATRTLCPEPGQLTAPALHEAVSSSLLTEKLVAGTGGAACYPMATVRPTVSTMRPTRPQCTWPSPLPLGGPKGSGVLNLGTVPACRTLSIQGNGASCLLFLSLIVSTHPLCWDLLGAHCCRWVDVEAAGGLRWERREGEPLRL